LVSILEIKRNIEKAKIKTAEKNKCDKMKSKADMTNPNHILMINVVNAFFLLTISFNETPCSDTVVTIKKFFLCSFNENIIKNVYKKG